MHVLPQLRKLEKKYADALTVIGVHSAKFNAEKATENVRAAVRRYDIGHPVVNDANFEIWKTYAVRAWPTLMFIDPEGKVLDRTGVGEQAVRQATVGLRNGKTWATRVGPWPMLAAALALVVWGRWPARRRED